MYECVCISMYICMYRSVCALGMQEEDIRYLAAPFHPITLRQVSCTASGAQCFLTSPAGQQGPVTLLSLPLKLKVCKAMPVSYMSGGVQTLMEWVYLVTQSSLQALFLYV